MGKGGKLNISIMEAHDFLYYGQAINEEEGWILDQREKELSKEAEDDDRKLLAAAMTLRKRGGKLALGINGELLVELCRMWNGLERSQAAAVKRRALYAEYLCGDLDWEVACEGCANVPKFHEKLQEFQHPDEPHPLLVAMFRVEEATTQLLTKDSQGRKKPASKWTSEQPFVTCWNWD